MHRIKKAVADRKRQLQYLIREKQKALQGADRDRLYASQHKNTIQFYRITPDGTREYLKKGDDRIRRLSQKEYDEEILVAAVKEERLIGKLNALYKAEAEPEAHYEKMQACKRANVTPIRETDSDYVKRWLAEPYAKLGFGDGFGMDSKSYYSTDHGEVFRSKSEMIIANLLREKGIPYKFECPLALRDLDSRNVKTVYPDFTILRISDRQEVYWEHLGLLDDPDYLARNLRKIRLYEMNGYFPGQKLILSSETAALPLDTRIVEQMIEAYCR